MGKRTRNESTGRGVQKMAQKRPVFQVHQKKQTRKVQPGGGRGRRREKGGGGPQKAVPSKRGARNNEIEKLVEGGKKRRSGVVRPSKVQNPTVQSGADTRQGSGQVMSFPKSGKKSLRGGPRNLLQEFIREKEEVASGEWWEPPVFLNPRSYWGGRKKIGREDGKGQGWTKGGHAVLTFIPCSPVKGMKRQGGRGQRWRRGQPGMVAVDRKFPQISTENAKKILKKRTRNRRQYGRGENRAGLSVNSGQNSYRIRGGEGGAVKNRVGGGKCFLPRPLKKQGETNVQRVTTKGKNAPF